MEQMMIFQNILHLPIRMETISNNPGIPSLCWLLVSLTPKPQEKHAVLSHELISAGLIKKKVRY